jgi:hypothetical protein
VRELENEVQRALALAAAPGQLLGPELLSTRLHVVLEPIEAATIERETLRESFGRLEACLIRRTLERANGRRAPQRTDPRRALGRHGGLSSSRRGRPSFGVLGGEGAGQVVVQGNSKRRQHAPERCGRNTVVAGYRRCLLLILAVKGAGRTSSNPRPQ